MQINEQGVKYVKTVGIPALKEEIKGFKFPDIATTFIVGNAPTPVLLKNITIQQLDISDIETGLTVLDTNALEIQVLCANTGTYSFHKLFLGLPTFTRT